MYKTFISSRGQGPCSGKQLSMFLKLSKYFSAFLNRGGLFDRMGWSETEAPTVKQQVFIDRQILKYLKLSGKISEPALNLAEVN